MIMAAVFRTKSDAPIRSVFLPHSGGCACLAQGIADRIRIRRVAEPSNCALGAAVFVSRDNERAREETMRSHASKRQAVLAIWVASAMGAAMPAAAQTPAEFYKGKTITLLVG